jgi:hypothetical protein
LNTVLAGLLLSALGALGALGSQDVGATAPVVDVVGGCPGHDALLEALRPVIGKDTLSSSRGAARVVDLGDRFDVFAAGQTARYVDTARDCGERARVAAVFIALALSPPSVRLVEPAPPPPTAPQPAVPTPEPRAPSGPPSCLWAKVGVGARVDSALAEDGAPSDLTAGGELAGTIGRGTFGIGLSAALLAPTRRTLQSVSVRQQRFPFGAGVVIRHRWSPWFEVTGKAALAVVLLTLRGENVSPGASSTRLDPGAHLSAELRGPPLREGLVPFVGLHVELFPRSYVLDADPVGRVGVTNRLWWGATAGLSFDLTPGE